jgi:DNA-binding transcriptional LysR family regulator
MTPDWVTLRIFLAAIELGSVTRAAGRYGIALSAAARRAQDLEAESGALLLEHPPQPPNETAPQSIRRRPVAKRRALLT